jgi:ferredoxin
VSDADPEYQITLVSRGMEITIPCRASEFILQAALDAGIELPYSCLQGWCVTCAARLLSGEVDQSASLRYYPEDAEARFTLLCTARPLSNVRVETHKKQAMQEHRVAHKLPVPLG